MIENVLKIFYCNLNRKIVRFQTSNQIGIQYKTDWNRIATDINSIARTLDFENTENDGK